MLSLAWLGTSPVFATTESNHGHEGEEDMSSQIKEDIQHHLQDAYTFHLFTDKESGTHVGFPLPVVLIDNGLHVFSSSKFHHGEDMVEKGGKKYFIYHNKIYGAEETIYLGEKKTRMVENEEGEEEEEEYVDTVQTMPVDEFFHTYAQGHGADLPEGLFVTNKKPLDFSITKNVFSIFFISILLLLMFGAAAKSYKKGLAPTGWAKFLEPIILFVRDEIAIPNIGEKDYKRFMSYLLTIFFFIWIVNLFGLTPLGINVTGNIAVTFALAFMTFLITQFSGRKEYWKHIFWMPGVPWPMKIILAPIELLGVFIKPFALLIRLYANITAGHVVLMSIIGMMFVFQNWIGSSLSFGLAFALAMLELLVAALQAYIFTMLTALYFGSAVAEHDDH